jgi:hypothetical protein
MRLTRPRRTPRRGSIPNSSPCPPGPGSWGSRHLLRVAPLRLAMQLELALFHILVRNELVPYGGGRFYVNAAHSTRSGTEAALTVSTDWGAALRLALTYGRYRYAHYRIDSSYFGRSEWWTTPVMPSLASPNCWGSAQLWLPLPTGLPLRWEVELQHTSSYYADDANTITVPAALLLSTAVRATEGLRLGDVGLLPWVELRNVLNRRHVGSVYINPDRDARGRPLFAEPGMPRALTWGCNCATDAARRGRSCAGRGRRWGPLRNRNAGAARSPGSACMSPAAAPGGCRRRQTRAARRAPV